MKRCPMCNRIYDDAQSFCFDDATPLIGETPGLASTLVVPPPQMNEIPPTQIISQPPPYPNYSQPAPQGWPQPQPTQPSPQQPYSGQNWGGGYPSGQSIQSAAASASANAGSSKLPLISMIAGLAGLAIAAAMYTRVIRPYQVLPLTLIVEPAAVVALTLGIVSLRSPNNQSKGRSIAGLVTGALAFLLILSISTRYSLGYYY